MSLFEGLLLFLAFLGIGIPAWILAMAVYRVAASASDDYRSQHYLAYFRLIEYIRNHFDAGKDRSNTNNNIFGPLFVATVRELKEYPKFADITLLYLEEIKVTGSNKFDRVMETELRDTEKYLLGMIDE